MKLSTKISVIIPTHKGYEDVLDAIKSLRNQTLKPFEIIVIDNASKENIASKLSKKMKNLQVRRLRKNQGVTGGRNAGIRLADWQNDYILIFDHDMIAEKKMLEELVKTAMKDKQIGIVTPKIYYTENKKVIWSAGTGMNLITGQVLFRGGKDTGQFNLEQEVQVAPAVMLVKKEVIKKVKKFDNIYFATYEDTDFCFRARENGFKTFYNPRAIAYHKIPLDTDNSNERLLERTFWVARNRIIFMKRFSKNYLLFLFVFTPAYLAYYFLLSIKYRNLKAIPEYIRGIAYGILEK